MIVVVASIATAFGQEITTKTFDLADYDRIEVESAIDVKLLANGTEGVSVECDERLIPAIKVVKNGNSLKLSLDWKKLKKITGKYWRQNVRISEDKVRINGMTFNGGLSIEVGVKNISEIIASSSASVSWDGNLPAKKLSLMATSSADIDWKGILQVQNLRLHCSSSGSINGDCKASKAIVNVSSSADYKGNLRADKAIFDVSSSGSINLTGVFDNLIVTGSSSGDFIANLKAKNGIFSLSSATNVKVQGVIDILSVTSTSSADFRGQKIVYQNAEVVTGSNGSVYLSKSGKVVDRTPRRTGLVIE